MLDYRTMDSSALQAEQGRLRQAYDAFAKRGLKLDMSRGKPAPNQLDLSMGLLAMQDYKDRDGVDMRNYGALEGAAEVREFFAELLGAQPGETIVGGSSSLNLMYNMVDLGWRKGFSGCAPWGAQDKVKFLCPSPGYDRHFRISEDFGFELITVPMTPGGPDMDAVERLAQDEAVKGIWCIPVYSNPDGYVYSAETVRRMAEMKAAPDFRVFWDNAYLVHHLTDEALSCPNMLEACRDAGNPQRAMMFCSTSKMTFAGAGVCAMAADAANIEAAKNYLFAMTICFDKVNQLRHVRFLRKEGLAAHMQKHAALIAPKFDAVREAFERELAPCGDIACWTSPKGGYFISLNVLDGCAARVVQLCREAGVVLTGAGAAFPYGQDPRDRHIRIAPSYPSAGELAAAAELLCLSVRLAAVEKLLA